MAQVIIENPVLNSPYREPNRHFRFSDDGITDEVASGRRTSSYFIPIARPRKKGDKQLQLETEWIRVRIEENKLANQIRDRVKLWREGGYVGVTPATNRLLAYWTSPDRENKLFFCQVEALETAIYITEVAKKYGDVWIENALREDRFASYLLDATVLCRIARPEALVDSRVPERGISCTRSHPRNGYAIRL